jgi:hypothetical protein
MHRNRRRAHPTAPSAPQDAAPTAATTTHIVAGHLEAGHAVHTEAAPAGRTRLQTFALAAAALGAVGCSAVDSSEVATRNLEARVEVVSEGGRDAHVTVTLSDARGGFYNAVELTGGDALSVVGPGGARALFGSGIFGDISYTNTVPLGSGASALRVVLDRPVHLPAPGTVVSLPPPFELVGSPLTFDFDFDVIPIRWTGPGEDFVTVSATGWCIADYETTLPYDPGYILIEPGELLANADWRGAPCELTVRVTRSRAGMLDPALAGGEVWGSQARTTRVWVAAYFY